MKSQIPYIASLKDSSYSLHLFRRTNVVMSWGLFYFLFEAESFYSFLTKLSLFFLLLSRQHSGQTIVFPVESISKGTGSKGQESTKYFHPSNSLNICFPVWPAKRWGIYWKSVSEPWQHLNSPHSSLRKISCTTAAAKVGR